MATSSSTLFSFRPAGIRASADSSGYNNRSKASSSGNWWTPIFGWGSNPDYIDRKNNISTSDLSGSADAGEGSTSELDKAGSRSRFTPGCFTEEKAKQLRLKIAETENFHDIMYHSAIASRLASDFPNRSAQ